MDTEDTSEPLNKQVDGHQNPTGDWNTQQVRKKFRPSAVLY